ncbi:MAG: hypothetical protein WAK31_10130 [Chthoniobacterales bacterium]
MRLHRLFFALSFFLLGIQLIAWADQPTSINQDRDDQHDFDFNIGTWKLHNRRLRNPLTGSNNWVEFGGTSVAQKIWDGRANMDEDEFNDPAGRIQGLTLRLYDPSTRLWSIFFANSRKGSLGLPPTVGRFVGDRRGEFYDYEIYDGKAVLVRYLYLINSLDSYRWEQAFSPDGGKTWETNWTIDCDRVKDGGSTAGTKTTKEQ